MKLNVLVAAIAGTTCALAAAAKPPVAQLQSLPFERQIEPLRMAAIVRGPEGKIFMAGPWVDCDNVTPRNHMYPQAQYDIYGRVYSHDADPTTCPPGTHCTMCDGTSTTLGPTDEGRRWYFGPTAHNPNTIDNIESFVGNPCNALSQVNHGFFYGVPVPTTLLIAHFVLEEFTEWNGTDCTDPASYTLGCSSGAPTGVLFDFGLQPPGAGYYIHCSDVVDSSAGTNLLMPELDDNLDGFVDGSHEIRYGLSYDSSTGVLTPNPGPVQPMLWGTGEDDGEWGRAGTHIGDQYDDDNADGAYSNPAECWGYNYPTLCPTVLGKMTAFLALYCAADYNKDGFVDAGDYDSFVLDFNNADPMIQAKADYNGDCFVDAGDYDGFIVQFNTLCE